MVHYKGRDSTTIGLSDDRFPGKIFWVIPEVAKKLLSGELKIERKWTPLH